MKPMDSGGVGCGSAHPDPQIASVPSSPASPASVDEARELRALAASQGVLITAFHNRRLDGDFLTLRSLLASGTVGDVALFQYRWDRHRTAVGDWWKEKPGPASGAFQSLGTQLCAALRRLDGLCE